MASLEALGISGFRSYSQANLQKIDFDGPLTLVWGKNGSGKTTIIEVLKYITTGSLPPMCQKGKNFILEPRIANKNEVVAQTRLKFRAFNNKPVLAKRRALLTTSNKGHKFQSLEQTLKTRDNNGELVEINHQCAQIQKQIPLLLGISKPVLENIVFCHQDESLWPFSDSANLKNIFDQMFETKRYTKIIANIWENHKEHVKYVRQNKKSLEYLKRLYDEDNKRKCNALRDMAQISQETEELVPLKDQVNEMGKILYVQQEERKTKNEKKFALVRKRGILEEKARSNKKMIDECSSKMDVINNLYQKETGKQLKVIKSQNSEEEINRIRQKLSQLSETKSNLIQNLEQSKNMNVYTQKQIEIMGEIKRAIDFMPQLKKQGPSLPEQEILNRIESKRTLLQNKKKELLLMKQQRDRIAIPNCLDLQLSEASYQERKQLMKNELLKAQQITHRIMYHYSQLYQPVERKSSKQLDNSIENKLREVQYKLKMLREDLEKYKNMPKTMNVNEEIFKLQFAGITMYENLYCFCLERKKCLFCSKPVTAEELIPIKAKCDKLKQKAQTSIEQLRRQNKHQSQVTIQPQQMIRKINQEIEKAELIQREYNQKYQQYCLQKQQQDQIILNDKLIAYLRRAGLQFKKTYQSFDEASNIDVFTDLISKYENFKFRLQSKGKQLKQYEERVKRNKEIEVEKSACEQRKNQLINKISQIEEDTKDYQVLSNIQKRLAALLKGRGKSKSKDINKDSKSSQQNKIQQINQKLKSTQKFINILTFEKDFYQISAHLVIMTSNQKQMAEEIDGIDRQLKDIEVNLQNFDKKIAHYNKIKLEFQSKRKELNLRSELCFSQYGRPVQKDYISAKVKIQEREEAAKGLEVMCRIIENAVSKYHQEKMEEVNKIIAEIWREVYHGNDISMIEIQASIEEDSKKKKNFHYSIVMQKQVGGNVKLQMKGRCSMGQKVLASIVIRLALAEVFSTGACILALDEPTTNLDRQHIDNLAIQLGKLIEMTEGKHLQLIIITHDIEFIKCLEKYTGHFYEVSRDENRYSIITKKEIREIYEDT